MDRRKNSRTGEREGSVAIHHGMSCGGRWDRVERRDDCTRDVGATV